VLPDGAAKKETAKASWLSIATITAKATGGGGQAHTRVMTDFRYDIFFKSLDSAKLFYLVLCQI
jgi:hypothetical protein